MVLVGKLIRGKIIEITLVIVFVLISIPVWQNFEKKVSEANVTTLEDYNIKFDVIHNKTDKIIINNDYYINKNYKIFLITNKKIEQENSKIIINNKEYNINEFYQGRVMNNYVYTLIDDYILAETTYYEIKPILSNKDINYKYMFEESADI